LPENYYKCLHGDNAHLALSEPESFALRDDQGRDWICHPLPDNAVESLSIREHAAAVFAADAKASSCGFRQEGTQIIICHCNNPNELPERLATSGPVAEGP